MGIEIRLDGFGKGVEALALSLLAHSAKIQNGAKAIVRKVTSELKKESQTRVPVDEKDLTNAHVMRIEGQGIDTVGTVYITETDPVKYYAIWIHEGFYNLGPLSIKKQMGQSEIVGRKFMQRAFDDNKERWRAYIVSELRRLIGL